jgi:death-on-curing protein
MRTNYLLLDEVLAIHADQIARYGGSHGLRDLGLLESALAMPEATFGGEDLHPSVHEKAGAYLFHLVKNHPFIDGNKRVGAMVAYVFLGMNGWRLVATEQEFVDLVIGVADGRVSKAEVAVFLVGHTGKR